MGDSVALETAAGLEPAPGREPVGPKLLAVLFLLFLVVSSDSFVSGVVSRFGDGLVAGRVPTPAGVAAQGVALVLFYAVASHLAAIGVI